MAVVEVELPRDLDLGRGLPDGEAEYWANSNFMEKDAAVSAAKAHQAHVMVAILNQMSEETFSSSSMTS